MWSAHWLPNDTVVSVSSDGTAVQWYAELYIMVLPHMNILPRNATSGEVVKALPPHPLALTSLSVNSSGSRALINSIEGTTMLWDLEDSRVTATKESFAQVKEGIDAGEPILHLRFIDQCSLLR